jgi:hypothetical protein
MKVAQPPVVPSSPLYRVLHSSTLGSPPGDRAVVWPIHACLPQASLSKVS